jgi:phosphate:Na+ symporter
MLKMIDNMESIADSIYQISIHKNNIRENKIALDKSLTANLDTMYNMVTKALEAMNSNLCGEYDKVDLETSAVIEKEINQYRDQLRATHLEAIKAGSYNYQTGTAYSGMYALYEKTADFIINVSEAIK